MPEIKAPELNPGACKGVDIIIISDYAYNDLQQYLNDIAQKQGFNSVRLSNRGKEIYENEKNQIIPQWFCRFETKNGDCDDQKITTLVNEVSQKFHWVQVEKLCAF